MPLSFWFFLVVCFVSFVPVIKDHGDSWKEYKASGGKAKKLAALQVFALWAVPVLTAFGTMISGFEAVSSGRENAALIAQAGEANRLAGDANERASKNEATAGAARKEASEANLLAAKANERASTNELLAAEAKKEASAANERAAQIEREANMILAQQLAIMREIKEPMKGTLTGMFADSQSASVWISPLPPGARGQSRKIEQEMRDAFKNGGTEWRLQEGRHPRDGLLFRPKFHLLVISNKSFPSSSQGALDRLFTRMHLLRSWKYDDTVGNRQVIIIVNPDFEMASAGMMRD